MSDQSHNWSQMTRDAEDHREFVGPAAEYDLNGAMQFNLLTFLGLREYHNLLDIGCGSLRGGRLFIVYLLANHYFGIEPEQWLVENAIGKEIGRDLIELKSPSFTHNSDFSCDIFDRKFDYIIAQGVFTHAPESMIRKCVSEAEKCMKSTSIFTVSYMRGDRNYEGDKWLYPKTSFYTPTRMAEIASSAGLCYIPIDWPHPRGAKWALLSNLENKSKVLDLVDKASKFHLRENIDKLQTKLAESEQALSRLRTHPYVKIGIKLNRLLHRLSAFK